MDVVITGYYNNITRSIQLKQWPGGPKSYLWQPAMPPQSSTDGKPATDSCFTLIGVHRCGILMVDVG